MASSCPIFEPQVDLATGEIVGFEVLARWIHPLSGIIGPDVFIPVAEEIGLIGRLSEQVIGEALREAASWDPAIKISVNISPSQLADGWLAQRIVRMLTETAFPAERLVIEITESSLFADIDLARIDRHQPQEPGRAAGARRFRHRLLVAVAPALAAVRHHQDRPQLRHQYQCQARERAIIRAVTTLAARLPVPVCVEGIENEEPTRPSSRSAAQIGQGWYFGKPMRAEQARELLAARERSEQPPPSATPSTADIPDAES